MGRHSYRKRVFLSPISTGFTSYVYAEAQSSDNGEYRLGNYLIWIADCNRRVELEFFLGSKRARQQSIAKAELLTKILQDFTKALKAEAALIDEFENRKKD